MRLPRRPTSALTAALVLALTGACSAPAGGTASEPPAVTGTAGTTSAPPSASATSSPGTSAPTPDRPAVSRVVATDVVAGDLTTPWGLARLPDGSHLVSLRDQARVVHIGAGGERTPVRGTGEDGRVAGVEPRGEGGLLGLALDPRDPSVLYAYLTGPDDNRVVAMTFRDDVLGEPRTLLSGIGKAGNHNGGRLAFGPDGYLYVTTGDAGRTSRSQDPDDLGGKILRVTREGRPAPGNPFGDSPVWTLGHRNVQGLGWDERGRMYASEFGQNTYDELNLIEPGRNYGWPEVEGLGTASDRERGFTPPLRVWATSEASPSGLAVGLGSVWMAALRGQRLWRVPLTGAGATAGRVGEPQPLLEGELGRLRAAEVQPDGSLLVLTDNAARSGREGSDQLVRVRLA